MKNRMITYLNWMNKMLLNNDETVNKELLMKRHLREIHFFQHERLVHLLVMILMVILDFSVFLTMLFSFEPLILLLFLGILVLVIPYIIHYYLLENGVQAMYYQYDQLYKQLHPTEPAPDFPPNHSVLKTK